ncbi:hypothetical protein [Deinococcus multiflagellatus]|uniref:Uncharacterized protein n=1 Tax=Deinococcus multiflagellatus TaxID=1656887 RepID=A0ABW1ZGT7_9DEIO|nr:hypothetical protein [Deinococcus multiflagellatus]MBZ9713745.1 hypothetical protein [Deinococcus multiflagellatus]
MKQLTLQDGAGGAPSLDFGEVPLGQQSPPRAIALRNTGTEPLTGIKVWIEQASAEDGELLVTLAGVAITGTSRATATPLPNLVPGQAHTGTAAFTSPSAPVDSATLRWAAD